MLRHPDASSTIEDLTQPRFLPVVPDREVVWVQEEPRNMGPFFYVMPRLTQLAQERGLVLRSVKRSSSASPATGSAKAHELEQKTLVSLAFITSSAS